MHRKYLNDIPLSQSCVSQRLSLIRLQYRQLTDEGAASLRAVEPLELVLEVDHSFHIYQSSPELGQEVSAPGNDLSSAFLFAEQLHCLRQIAGPHIFERFHDVFEIPGSSASRTLSGVMGRS